MKVDSEAQKQILLEFFNRQLFPGAELEIYAALKKAIEDVEIEP